MYAIKLCINLPTEGSYSKQVPQWKLLDVGMRFTNYKEAKEYIHRLEVLNKTEPTPMDFWVSEENIV